MKESDEAVELEFQHVIEGVDALHACAVEHESRQAGPEKEPCLENRAWIIAMAMHRMGLGVAEIGIVAEHLFDIECEHANAEADEQSEASDSILDESDINVE